MKMLIPVIGDQIVIKKRVTLELKNTSQNKIFLDKYDECMKNIKQIKKDKHHITLEKDTLLTIDRVYIRQGDSSDYNSITFKISNDKNLPNGRFFIPISEANNLEIEFLEQKELIKTKKLYNYMYEKTNKRKTCSICTGIDTLLSKKEIYNFDINFNIATLLNLTLKDIDSFFNDKIGKTYKEVEAFIIETLNNDKININKDIANKAIEDLFILENTKIDISNIKQSILKYNNSPIFNVKAFKITEKQKIKEEYILRFEYNEAAEDIFELIRIYLNNINCLIYKYKLFNEIYLKEPKYYYDNINIITKLIEGKKFLNRYDYKEKIYSNHYSLYIIESDSGDYFYTYYNDIKFINLLNINATSELNLDKFISFKDEEGNKNVKQIRSMLTKRKKD